MSQIQAIALFTFVSSRGTKTYETRLYEDGSLSCNCSGWTFQRPGKPRGCKHTHEVAEFAGRILSGEHRAEHWNGRTLIAHQLANYANRLEEYSTGIAERLNQLNSSLQDLTTQEEVERILAPTLERLQALGRDPTPELNERFTVPRIEKIRRRNREKVRLAAEEGDRIAQLERELAELRSQGSAKSKNPKEIETPGKRRYRL